MIATALSLVGSTTTKVYSLTSIVDSKSIRKDSTAAAGLSNVLTVNHGKRNPKDPQSPDRRLVRLDWTKPNLASVPETLSMQFVLEQAPTTTFTDTDVEDMKNQLINFLAGSSGATFNQFQAGEP